MISVLGTIHTIVINCCSASAKLPLIIVQTLQMSNRSVGGFSDELNDSASQVAREPQDQNCFQIYGMHFCGQCKNMMIPYKENGEKLEFMCKSCKVKEIDFTHLRDNQCVIYNKQLKPGTRKAGLDTELALDPTMPRIMRECEDCGHDKMVYIVNADESQSYLVISLICENVAKGRCDHIEELSSEYGLINGQALEREDFEEIIKDK